MLKRKFGLAVTLLLAMLFLAAVPAMAADSVDITAGLSNVDKSALAQKIIAIATGIAALAGAIGVISLIYAGFRFMSGGEKERAEAKQQIIFTFAGLGLTGLAVMIVGFIAYLIKG